MCILKILTHLPPSSLGDPPSISKTTTLESGTFLWSLPQMEIKTVNKANSPKLLPGYHFFPTISTSTPPYTLSLPLSSPTTIGVQITPNLPLFLLILYSLHWPLPPSARH